MDLVDKIFQSEPSKRIDIEGILRHPWTVKVSTNLLRPLFFAFMWIVITVYNTDFDKLELTVSYAHM